MQEKSQNQVQYKEEITNVKVRVIGEKDCKSYFTEYKGYFPMRTRCIQIYTDAYFEMVSTSMFFMILVIAEINFSEKRYILILYLKNF